MYHSPPPLARTLNLQTQMWSAPQSALPQGMPPPCSAHLPQDRWLHVLHQCPPKSSGSNSAQTPCGSWLYVFWTQHIMRMHSKTSWSGCVILVGRHHSGFECRNPSKDFGRLPERQWRIPCEEHVLFWVTWHPERANGLGALDDGVRVLLLCLSQVWHLPHMHAKENLERNLQPVEEWKSELSVAL